MKHRQKRRSAPGLTVEAIRKELNRQECKQAGSKIHLSGDRKYYCIHNAKIKVPASQVVNW